MDSTEANSHLTDNSLSPADIDRLKTQHSLLENQISELEELRFPTETEESKIKMLKKEKLAIKEKIERHVLHKN